MPGATKKELYLAKSIGQLNELAELPAKFKSTAAKLLVKTSDKMLKEAQHSEMMGDEERAYVLFMKYFNVVTYLKKTADYKKQKAYYDDLLGPKNLLTSIDKAEALSKSLKERYDQLEAESVASKLSSLDSVEKTDDKVEPDPKLNEQDQDKKNKKTETDKKSEEPVPKTSPGVITCQQLFDLFEDRDAQLIIMDVRPIEEFQETRINHKNIINVPAEAIKPGTTVTYIEKALPMDSLSLWKQRGNIDHIILLDWNSNADKVTIGTSLQTLKDALFKYDSTVIIKSEPLILDGGYEQWMLQYPTKCVNPVFDKLTKPKVISAQDTLMDFDYPDFDETFMTPQPARTNSIDSSGSSASLSSSSSVVNGDLSGSLPRIDRSTKPKIDRSTKSNVTTVQVNQSKTGSLYPDMKTVSRPGASLYRDTSDTGSQNNSLSFRNTDIRAAKTITAGGSDTSSQDNKNSSNLSAQSTELSDDLKELESQKKRKMEELRKLEQDYERMEAESRARMEKLRLEEKRLSDLEDLKKKQQMDVADLMRMKRNIQSNMVEEKQRVEQEQEQKQLEERHRREELEQLSKAEDEKRRRQEEVNRLRMDRKKKEEEKQEYERKLKEEKELQEARERARLEEELRQKDISAAEERARQLKIEEDRKAREKIQMEERIQQERELAAKLERERQAALEEKRRKQAEIDRLETEKREKLRQEKERAEKERLEIERRKREEEDRQKAAEAKRIADEKLRLMNEAKSKPKLIPSPHLLKGWEKQLDPRTNRYFYINHNDGTTQWDPPNLQGEEKGGTYMTKLKDEPSTPKSSLKRSSSSPNIAQLFENEPKISDRKAPPSVDRGIKPIKRPMPVALPAKRRDLNPVYGNVGRALTGLRNLGNTCYMNSTIQCLNNTSPLVTYLLTDMYLFDINRGEKSGSLWELTDDFAFLVKALWSGQYRCINPRDFKSVVGRQQPMFAGYEQQDSQEFLTFLLDGLHEGLNKVKTRPKIAEQENDKLPDHVAAELAWKDHKLHNESIIVELFQGQLKSTIMCLTCRKRSVTFQAFMFLSLPIPSSSRCSLQDCLRQFAAEEKMTGSSRWKCPQCRCYRDSVKNIVIWKLPPILLVALNRFVYEGQWRTKINAHVDFPVRDLDMSSFVRGPQPRPYKLYAVSNHFGTLDGGHYTACCRNPNTQKWYKFDDHEVFETSESSVKTSAAYVLYYTSIELLPPDFKPSFS